VLVGQLEPVGAGCLNAAHQPILLKNSLSVISFSGIQEQAHVTFKAPLCGVPKRRFPNRDETPLPLPIQAREKNLLIPGQAPE
jgi:hypothetical protein